MKKRLDIMMVEQGLAPSREKAKAYIMAGEVYVNGQKEDKAGSMFAETAKLEVRGKTLPYVSRGGLKLEKAMKNFGVTLNDKVCMDVGASTGGFTDCMLQNGAVKVYSIDVGYGQLDWKLRNDPRVVCMEKTNIRYVVPEDLEGPAAFSSIDVSFISLTKVLLPVRNLLTEDGEIVCLIKPQFEAGREKVGKKGVVRDPKVHEEVIEKVRDYAMSIAMEPCHLSFSPIKGPEGNIEYLLHLKKHPEGTEVPMSLDVSVEDVVKEAHGQLTDVWKGLKQYGQILYNSKQCQGSGTDIFQYDHRLSGRTWCQVPRAENYRKNGRAVSLYRSGWDSTGYTVHYRTGRRRNTSAGCKGCGASGYPSSRNQSGNSGISCRGGQKFRISGAGSTSDRRL